MSDIRIQLVPPSELPPTWRTRWVQLCQRQTSANHGTDNPFMYPDYAEHVQRVWEDRGNDHLNGGPPRDERLGLRATVAVILDGDDPVGFAPLQVSSGGPNLFNRSIGRWLNLGNKIRYVGARCADQQGIITDNQLDWDPRALSRALGSQPIYLAATSAQHSWAGPFVVARYEIQRVNLTDGYEQLRLSLKKRGSEFLEQAMRKQRRFEREQGELAFELQSMRGDHLLELMRFKREQYRRTSTFDMLAADWVVSLLQNLHNSLLSPSGYAYQGVLSTLTLKGRLVAAHYGLRADRVLSLWITAYDPAFAKYSPGAILIYQLLRSASEAGICRFDLGQGDERFKQQLGNDELPVAELLISNSPLTRSVQSAWSRSRNFVSKQPWCAKPLGQFRAVRNRYFRSA